MARTTTAPSIQVIRFIATPFTTLLGGRVPLTRPVPRDDPLTAGLPGPVRRTDPTVALLGGLVSCTTRIGRADRAHAGKGEGGAGGRIAPAPRPAQTLSSPPLRRLTRKPGATPPPNPLPEAG